VSNPCDFTGIKKKSPFFCLLIPGRNPTNESGGTVGKKEGACRELEGTQETATNKSQKRIEPGDRPWEKKRGTKARH